MSKLNELIKELCPDGVKYKQLKEICDDIIVPMRDRPKVFDGNIPWCRIEDKEGQYFHKSLSGLGVSQEVIDRMNLKVFPEGTVICSCSASIGHYAINTQPLITNQTFIGLVCGERLYNKYLLYFMETQTEVLKSLTTTGTIPYISRKKFEELLVPLPPLEIQEEIVKILDKFTDYVTELQAELQARRQQHEYYSRKYFESVKHNADKELVEDICYIQKGTTPIQKAVPGEYPLVVTTDERKTNTTYQFDSKSVCIPLVSSRGHGVASLNHVYYQEGKFALGNILCALTPKDESILSARYLYYYFEETKDYTLVPLMKGGANVALRVDDIKKVNVPLPPIDIQERIVRNLETLNLLCKEVLPVEIEARQKQYEYYRDKLLTFKELS